MFGAAACLSTGFRPRLKGRRLYRRSALHAGRPPLLDNEAGIRTYLSGAVVPGCLVQPDFQYIFHPGGGALNPLNPAAGRIPDAAVFGLRTTIKF